MYVCMYVCMYVRTYVCIRHYAMIRNMVGSIPDEVIQYFYSPNPFSSTVAQVLTQPLTDMSTRNLPGTKRGAARTADNLTAICEPTV
jgi:hypothetical protein